MHPHTSGLLSCFRNLFIFLLVIGVYINNLRGFSSAQFVDERNRNCSHPFQCGNISASFPFWGQDRPSYCGQPEFQLNCTDNNTALIGISSQRYRLIGVNNETQVLNIAPMASLVNICPVQVSNNINTTFIPSSLLIFQFTSATQILSLFSNCSASALASLPSGSFFNYNCSSSTNDPLDFYIFENSTVGLGGICNDDRVDVPVLQTAVTKFWRNSDPSNKEFASVLNKGFEVRWSVDGAPCGDCIESGGQCGYNSTSSTSICFCSDRPYQTRCSYSPIGKNSNIRRKVGIVVGISVVSTILAAILAVWVNISKKKSLSDTSTSIERLWNEETINNDHQNVEAFFRNYGSLAPKRFRYMEVKKMTNSFKEKLGQGGFGSVFKGQLHNGRLVAVKVLISKSKNDGQDFINEVASISRTSHVNVVTLLGFCFDGNKRALIYEFMPNGSLDKFIYAEKQPSASSLMLGLETLYKIAVGIARGLEYLHRGCNTRILHFDIKPHNILLDEDFSPKISDFGLAKLCPGKESIISMLDARGTAGYIAPELFNRNFGAVSYKSDVYSYGMMVLEMVGGRKNIDVKVGMDHSSQLYYPHWIYDRLKLGKGLGLNEIMTEEKEETTKKMIIVGLWCIQTNPSSRPSMSKVLEMLEGSTAALQIPPKPFLSSPPGSPTTSVSSSTISIS